jgi:ribosomal protein L15
MTNVPPSLSNVVTALANRAEGGSRQGEDKGKGKARGRGRQGQGKGKGKTCFFLLLELMTQW